MPKIPKIWIAPWGDFCHKTYEGATKRVYEWYQEEQIKVILEMGQWKEKIKQWQINYDVSNIDIYEPMSRLREGKGDEDDWASFKTLGEDIDDTVLKIQNGLHAIDLCRRHLEFLKTQIKQAKEDYEEAIELTKPDNNTSKKEKEKADDDTSPKDKQDNDTSSM